MIKKKRFCKMMLAGLLAFSLTACSSSQEATDAVQGQKQTAERIELYVLAAASLSDALKDLKPLYEKEHQGISLVTTFGSSGTLQQQIEQGAPADLFISAGAKQMNALVERGLVEKEKQTALLNNELVLIVQKGSAASVSSFSDVAKEELKKVAVGQPETVPAGTYAKQTFTRLGLWEQLQDKVVFTKDVRQVLTYVETGNTEAGVVYKTDALSSDKVEIAATADAATHEPIVYPLGIVQATKHPRETEALYQWLQGEEAKQIFAKYGFQTAAK